MISTLLELLALAGLVKTASFAGGAAAWAVASLGLLFLGYALGDSPMDRVAWRQWIRLRTIVAMRLARRRAPEPVLSPQPEIRISPEVQDHADRLVAARLRRGQIRDRTAALSRWGGEDD